MSFNNILTPITTLKSFLNQASSHLKCIKTVCCESQHTCSVGHVTIRGPTRNYIIMIFLFLYQNINDLLAAVHKKCSIQHYMRNHKHYTEVYHVFSP